MAHSYKIIEGGPSHADKLMIGNAADKLGTLSVGAPASAGTNQATGVVLTDLVLQAITGANDTKAARLPAGFAGQILFLANVVTDKYLLLYPPTSGTINGQAGDAVYNIPNGQLAVAVCSSAGVWHLSCEAGT